MLAPHCEAEASEPVISRLGIRSPRTLARSFSARLTAFNARWCLAHAAATAARLRALRQIDIGPPAARRPRRHRNRTVAGGPFPRGACFIRTKAMSNRGACCRNCTPASPRPVRNSSNSIANPVPTTSTAVVIDCPRTCGARCPAGTARRQGEIILDRDAMRSNLVAPGAPDRIHHCCRSTTSFHAAATASCWGATSIESEDDGISVRSALSC